MKGSEGTIVLPQPSGWICWVDLLGGFAGHRRDGPRSVGFWKTGKNKENREKGTVEKKQKNIHEHS